MGNSASSCPWALELMGFGPSRCAAVDAPDSVQINNVTFQVIRTLGEGGYAVVFAAREVASQRRVALKRIRFPADALPAVEREVSLHMEAARNSPGVVQVVDVELRRPGAPAAGGARWGGGTGPGSPSSADEEGAASGIGGTLRSHDGECWMVLELCEGGGAAQLVEECIAQARSASVQRPSGIPRSLPPTYGAVPLPVIFCVLDNAIRALAALHRLEPAMAHWDVKLENILLQGDVGCGATLHDDVVTATAQSGRYPLVFKLCDFGSATRSRIAPCANGAQVARASVLLEQRTTLLYKAPEAIDLWSRRAVDTKADLWALGVVLYVLLCGRMPFDENPLQISKAAYTPIPVALREESCPLAPLVAFVTDGLLVEDPSARWSVFELSRRLTELTPLHQTEAGPVNTAAVMPDITL